MNCFRNCFLQFAIGIGAWAVVSAIGALVGALFGPGAPAFLTALAAIAGLTLALLVLAAIACLVGCGLARRARRLRAVAQAQARTMQSSSIDALEKGLTLHELFLTAQYEAGFVAVAGAIYASWDRFASIFGL